MLRRPLLLSAIFVLVTATRLHAQDTTGVGSVSGTVVAASGRPAAGVEICVLDVGRCATSDASGAFRITEVRAGLQVLEIRAPAAPAFASDPIDVRAGLDGRVEITLPSLEALTRTVTVTAPAFVPPGEIKSSGFLIRRVELLKAAGALQDVSRYVQNLPGVVIGSDDFRNDIIVRGGSPLENLFVVDNVEIPNINTFANFASAGGSFGIVDAALTDSVTFLTGGYPAPYVNRASSVLQIAQREGSREQLQGRATLGFAGAGAIVEGPLNRGRGSWVVSARRSFVDLVTDDVGFGGVPVTYTLNGKVVYDLSPRDRLWAVNLTGHDAVRLGATDSPDDEDAELQNFDVRYRGWRSVTGFNWQRVFGTHGVALLGVSHAEAHVGSQIKDLVRDGIPPPDLPVKELIATSPIVFREDSREAETTLKYDVTTHVRRMGKLQAGGSAKRFRLGYDADQPFGNDSPYSAEPGVNAFALRQQYTAYQIGAYVQATQDLTPRLNLTWGARLDDYDYIGRTRVSPRAGLSYALTPRLSARASYGLYFQQPFFLFLSAFPENRSLLPFRVAHYVTGVEYRVSDTARFTVEAYRKDYKDYPVSRQFPTLSLANVGDTFNVRDILFPLVSAGRGQSRGLEVFAEKKASGRWFGQAHLAVSRTRHAGLDEILRPGSFDYPFVANAVGGRRVGARWEVSVRAAYLAGRPYTPFDVDASTAARRGLFDLDRVNAGRAPAYVRLDVRVDRTVTIAGRPVLFFAGVQNATNRRNVAGYTWNRRGNMPIVNEQLGAFPVLGLDWKF